MNHAFHRTRQFVAEEESATATEYAFLLVLFTIGAIATLAVLGQKVAEVVDNIQNTLGAVEVKKKRR